MSEIVIAAVAPLIAKTAHQANRAYQEIIGEVASPCWEDLVDELKDMAVRGVKEIIANPKIKASELHESWLQAKLAAGWRYGPEKSIEHKTHPCMVIFEQLPESQKTKDRLFLAVVKTLAKELV